jgi:hypothetical protein
LKLQRKLFSIAGTYSFKAIRETTNIDILFGVKEWGLQNFMEYTI